jgi:hypothetical protein
MQYDVALLAIKMGQVAFSRPLERCDFGFSVSMTARFRKAESIF